VLSHARVEPANAPPAHIDAPAEPFEPQPEIDVEIFTEIDAEFVGAGVPASDIVQLPTGDILVRRHWSFNDTKHHGPDLTCFKILKSSKLDEPPPLDRRAMFSRMMQADGALAAVGPWLEEYVSALTALLHPTDFRLDKPALLALYYEPDGPERVYRWSAGMVAACPATSDLLLLHPEMTVESVMPGDTVHFRTMPDDCLADPNALLNFSCSISTFLAESARFKSPLAARTGFGQTAIQLLDPTCDWNLCSQGITLSTSNQSCKAGVYGWVLLTLCETWIVLHRILEVLVGKIMCFFPILILCIVHGFCPAHPHPESGSWIFAWTPWAGFTLGCPNVNPAASNTRITITSGTRWLREYLKEGKAANKVEKAEARAEKAAEKVAEKAAAKAKKAKAAEKAEKAKAAELDEWRQTNGMVSGDCPKCGRAYLDLRMHKQCRGRRTTVPARFQD